MIDLSSIDIDSLSAEEIEDLLPQIKKEMAEAKKAEAAAELEKLDRPIHERVNEKFDHVWEDFQCNLTRNHDLALQRDRDIFNLDEGMKIILESTIGESHCKTFFRTLRDCIRKRDFKSNGSFYRKVNDKDVGEVARIAFAVYRLNLSKIQDGDHLEAKWIKKKLPSMVKSDAPMVRALVSDFREVGFIPPTLT